MSTQAAVVERAAHAAEGPRRRLVAGAWLLSGAMVVSGALAYAFHVLAARALGPHAYGQIAVLWAAMFLVAVVLFRPVEQTASRAIAERLARGGELRTVLHSVALIGTAILAACVAGAALGWGVISDRLFLGDDVMTALLVTGIAAYGLAYLVRGVLGGVRWFNGYGIGLIVDAVVRLLVALPLIVVASKSVAGAAMVAAGLAGAFIPLYVGRGRLSSVVVDAPGKRFSLTTALAFAAPASIIAIADQFLVNGGSLLVMLEGGADASKAAGIVFAATMLVRAPVYVFQGLAASLLPNLTHIHALDDTARFRRAVLRTVGFLLAAGVLIVAFAAVAGPETMKVLYGTGFEVGRYELTLLAAGVGCYLAAATCSQALLALDSGARAAVAWTTSSAVFIALYFLLSGSELERISLAFVLTALVDFALLGFGLARKLGIR